MTGNAKVYIALVSAAGMAAMARAFLYPQWPHDPFRFCTYFLLSLLAATLKLRLPGLTETVSIGFVFVLLGISELTLPETMLVACAGVVVQCLWRAQHRPAPVQVLFSVSALNWSPNSRSWTQRPSAVTHSPALTEGRSRRALPDRGDPWLSL